MEHELLRVSHVELNSPYIIGGLDRVDVSVRDQKVEERDLD